MFILLTLKVGKQAHRPTYFTQLTRHIDLHTPFLVLLGWSM